MDGQNQTQLTVRNIESKESIDDCLNFNLSQSVLEPTRVARVCSKILDWMLANDPEGLSITYAKLAVIKLFIQALSLIPNDAKLIKKAIRLYDKGNYYAINSEQQTLLPAFQSAFRSRAIKVNWTNVRDKINELKQIHS